MKFRKKPVVIDAHLWGGEYGSSGSREFPNWFICAMDTDRMRVHGRLLHIKTLEGVMTASEGDMIILGVKGEIYPCKPDIFEATYEPVN